MKVLFLGSTQIKHIKKVFLHCGYQVAELDNKDSGFLGKTETFLKLCKSDMVYCVGGVDIDELIFFRFAKFLKKRIVVHWIGTDVLEYTKRYQENKKIINKNCINLVVSNHLQEELKNIKIESVVVPVFPPDFFCEIIPAPEKHSVLSYIPEFREDFYGISLVKKIAEHFKNVDFYIVANEGKNDTEKLPNMHYKGYLNATELRNLYAKCSVLFRFPEHDGLPVMMLEALGTGREVVYCYNFPYVHTPKSRSVNDIIETFNEIFSSPPKENSEAVDYVKLNYSMERQIEIYKELNLL